MMTVDRMVFAMAGVIVLLSILLAVYHNLNWLWLTAFVGVNLLQSAFTGFCPAAIIFKKLRIPAGCAFK
ncbi:MAG: DUF2892 domain-containing protein [Thiolinea sp.]